jgi:hypothetical protein
MTSKKILVEEYGYNITNGINQRCINCKHINCRKIKSNGNKIRIQCIELTNYVGKNVYVGYNNICDLYATGYIS